MPDKKKKRKKRSKIAGWIVPALITLCMFAGGAFGVKTMMKTDESKRRRQIQMIKVLEPQEPPKKIEEEPPEPEEQVVKQEVQEIAQEQFVEDNVQQDMNESADDAPAGQDLGLDADGSAGSDGFGLVGKKGGRALIGGSHGTGSLLSKYSWYIVKVQDEIKTNVKEILDQQGVVPKGSLKTTVTIALDDEGRITDYAIVGSSGNSVVDDAVKKALTRIRVSENPPEGMPRSLKIRVSATG